MMGNEVSHQLLLFGKSILLGLSIGAAYDLLGPFRQRSASVVVVLDAVYCLAVGAAVFLFLLRRGTGELRGFMILGCVGGCVLFFCAFSEWLRPVWKFWTDTLMWMVHMLIRPVRRIKNFCKKTVRQGKNLFYFIRKCYTIRRTKWGRRRHAWQKEPKSRKTQKRVWRQSL